MEPRVTVLHLTGDIRAMVELAKRRTSCEYLLIGDFEGIFVRWETDHVWYGSILPGNYRGSQGNSGQVCDRLFLFTLFFKKKN